CADAGAGVSRFCHVSLIFSLTRRPTPSTIVCRFVDCPPAPLQASPACNLSSSARIPPPSPRGTEPSPRHGTARPKPARRVVLLSPQQAVRRRVTVRGRAAPAHVASPPSGLQAPPRPRPTSGR